MSKPRTKIHRARTGMYPGRAAAHGALVIAALLAAPVATVAQGAGAGQEIRGEGDRPTAGRPSTGSEPLLYRVTLASGTVYYGTVVAEGDPLVLELRDGEVVEMGRDRVAKIEEVRGSFVEGEFWPADPNETRLLFTATGRSLPAGGGSFNAYYGVMPFLAVGLTDRFSLAGGTPLFFGGDGGRLFYLAPKFQAIRTEGVQAAVGVLALHFTNDVDDGWYLAYGVATVEMDAHSGVTVGAGWGRSGGEWSSKPAVVLGVDHRVSRRARLLTENYFLPGEGGIVSAGVRLLGERLSADLALAAPVGDGGGFVFPLVNFSYGW